MLPRTSVKLPRKVMKHTRKPLRATRTEYVQKNLFKL